MDWYFRKLKAQQIEKMLNPLSHLNTPSSGWVKAAREVLGMTTRQLGERCNVTSERIIKIESDEVKKNLTMKTLEKVAESMDCRFVYGLVPNSGFIESIEKAAEQKARQIVQRISHTMQLEDQKLSNKELEKQIDLLKAELLGKNIKKIWDK